MTSSTTASTATKSAKPKTAKAEERYIRPSITSWGTPMMAPFLTISASVALYAAFGPQIPYGPRIAVGVVGLLVGGVLGMVYVAMLALIDVMLLAIRVRQLPAGRGAWLASAASPLLFLGSYAVLKPWTYWRGGPWTVLAMVLVPMIVAAFVSRLARGARPHRG